tara:strand:+ start:1569 stop:1784 length:216 start_codon:yes stop_codon:yes gene_type:complete
MILKISLNCIKKKISNKIVVRSSAIGDDSIDKSEAGKFETILNIDVSDSKKIKKAINQVIKSYYFRFKEMD